MLTECESCQEPLTGDVKACSKCGTRNPFFERSPPSPLAMTLLVLGVPVLVSVIATLLGPYLPRTAVLAGVMGGGVTLLGAVGVAANLRMISTRRQVLARGKRSLGTIRRSILHQSSSDPDDEVDYSPMVQFTTDTGLSVQFKATSQRIYRWVPESWSASKQVGKQVEVAYDPANPRKAFVVGRPDPQLVWALVYGVGFIVAGIATLVTYVLP